MNLHFYRAKVFSILAVLFLPLIVCGQVKEPTLDQFVGNYKGTARIGSGEMDVVLEIKSENGKLTGRAVAAETEFKISSLKITGQHLMIRFGEAADAPWLRLQLAGDKLVGDWAQGNQKGTVEFRKVEPSGVDVISGDWDGVADAQGEAFPFTLSLKLEGEKVVGSSSSQLGVASISIGSWKDGKLAIMLEEGAGQIAMVATMVDGKLSGDYDFAGQSTGKWVAIKKK